MVMQELRGGVQIVVATPGRLLDLVNDGALTLASVDYIVLDEADRMVTTHHAVAMGLECSREVCRVVPCCGNA